MNVHQWFPTTVFQETLDLSPAELGALADEVRELERPDGRRHGMIEADGFSTYHYDGQVLARPAFAAMRQAVLEEVDTVVGGLECRLAGGRLAISNSWANVYRPGSSVSLHDHGGAMLSGALYLQASPGSHIFFRNPLLHRHKGSRPLPFAEVQAIEVRAGELLLFPGWLEHRTDPNPGPKDKIVLSFNVVYHRDETTEIPVEVSP